MFTPEQMDHIHVLFSDRDLQNVVDSIVQLGTLQVMDSADMESWAQTLQTGGSGKEPEALRNRRDAIEALMNELMLKDRTGFKPSENSLSISTDEQIQAIQDEIQSEIKRKDQIEEEAVRLREIKRHVSDLPRLDISIENHDTYSYLAVETGRIPSENLEILKRQLSDILHVLVPLGEFGDLTNLLAISLRRNQSDLKSALAEAGFQSLDFSKKEQPVSKDVLQNVDKQLAELNEQLDGIHEHLVTIAHKHRDFLYQSLYDVRRAILKERILKYFRKTDHTFLVSGWLPSQQRDTFTAEIRRATQNRCIIETVTASDVESVKKGRVDVPVQLKNPTLIKPFELITSAYGMPAYRTIDPTPIMGISFLIIFGLMFGDVGHGLVLALTGALMMLKGRTDFSKHAGLLLIYVGASSMAFGFLFGSLFGFDSLSWLPALWMRPMESISELFKVCITLGMVMIFISILINVINAVRLKQFWDVIFDKAGLLAALLYWTGIMMASRIVSDSPTARAQLPVVIPILLVTALVLLFFREPIIHLFQGKKKLYPEGMLTGVISGIIELMEIALGFLANTVSFIRVAAFGLVHAGLAMAIFSLSDSVGGVGSVVIIIFGNIFIILLEGLVVSIQSVRLEFYEFFSRFFREGEVKYKPIKMELGKI